MAKRILSHLLISVAVFVLTATFFLWVIDARVLDAQVFTGELRKANVTGELSDLLPQMLKSGDEASKAEQKELEEKLPQAITSSYIDTKIMSLADSLITFIKNGEPDPTLDLTDFPNQLTAAGIEVDESFKDDFKEPIALNENGELSTVHDGYELLSLLKYAGIVLFVLLLLAEWYLSERGQKLKRLSRVFLYAGISYLIYWILLVVAPSRLSDSLNQNIKAEYDTSEFVEATLGAVQGLFSMYFLVFAISSISIAVILYVIRHYRHGDVMPSVDKGK